MLPVRCIKCGRAGLPAAVGTKSPIPVAHVREDLPGQPCKAPRWIEGVLQTHADWQRVNLKELIDAAQTD